MPTNPLVACQRSTGAPLSNFMRRSSCGTWQYSQVGPFAQNPLNAALTKGRLQSSGCLRLPTLPVQQRLGATAQARSTVWAKGAGPAARAQARSTVWAKSAGPDAFAPTPLPLRLGAEKRCQTCRAVGNGQLLGTPIGISLLRRCLGKRAETSSGPRPALAAALALCRKLGEFQERPSHSQIWYNRRR